MKGSIAKETRHRLGIIASVTVILISTFHGFAQQKRGSEIVHLDGDGKSKKVKLYEGSYALVIGESDYTDGWDKLRGVKDDVPAVRDALEKHGFEVTVVMNAVQFDLKRAIDAFIDEHGYTFGNRLVIYFAGHGYTSKVGDGRELGYIVPTDAPLPSKDPLNFQRKAISMDTIQSWAERITAKHALFVFDSCFSGKLVSRGESMVTSFLLPVVGKPVRQFITSGAANQTVPDESDFRKLFVRALAGEGDENKDGFILGSELGGHLKLKVTAATKGLQTPQYATILNPDLNQGEVVFLIGEPVVRSDGSSTAILPPTPPATGRGKPSASMDVAAAQTILDRAIANRDGSSQGQIQAIESLLARGHDFNNTILSGINFASANLNGGKFQRVLLDAVDLRGATAIGADLTLAELRFAFVEGAVMTSSIMKGVYAPFLFGRDVDFARADLADANFVNADLRNANFSDANLQGASFAFADLRGAKFDRADLTRAHFVGALVDEATFVGSIISDTEFTGTVAARFQLTTKQIQGACRHPLHDEGPYVSKGAAVWGFELGTRGEKDSVESEVIHLDNFANQSLRICLSEPLSRYFNPQNKKQYSKIDLDSLTMAKAGRRNMFAARLRDHAALLVVQHGKWAEMRLGRNQ